MSSHCSRWLTCVVLFAMAPLSSFATAADVPQNPFEIVKLADGVFGFLWSDPLQNPIEGNSLFIVNDHDVVVVDTGFFPSSARVMAAELKKLTPNPVRYVVTTHWHDDHHNGNHVFHELWPDAEFVAHRDTRTDILEQTFARRAEDIEKIQGDVDKYTRWVADGKDDEGHALDAARSQRVQEFAEFRATTVRELKSVVDTPPELTFVDQLVLHRTVGGVARTIEIRWLGRGNTRGDTVVFLPRERIAATGDLIVQPIPFGIGSYYAEWIATLDRLDALGADVLFPGHGPVMRDREALHQVRGLLQALVDRVREAVADRVSLEDVKKTITLADWKLKIAGGDSTKQAAFDQWFVGPAVERCWYQEKGESQSVE